MIDEKKLIEEMNETYYTKMNCDTTADWFRGFDMAMKIVRGQPKVMEWIPVSERLPEKPWRHVWDVYLVQEAHMVQPYTAYWNGEGFEDDYGKTGTLDILAWMPLPEPYKGE